AHVSGQSCGHPPRTIVRWLVGTDAVATWMSSRSQSEAAVQSSQHASREPAFFASHRYVKEADSITLIGAALATDFRFVSQASGVGSTSPVSGCKGVGLSGVGPCERT